MRTVFIAAMIVFMILTVACDHTSFVGTWDNANGVIVTIADDSPYEVFTTADGETYHFIEFDNGISDDGEFDFVLLDNSDNVAVGLRLPHGNYERIEFMIFDGQGNIAIEDIFFRQ